MEVLRLFNRIGGLGRAAVGGFVGLLLLVGAFATPARATLVYVTGGFPTTPPKVPQPEWIWAAHNDGSAAHRLVRGSAPHVSPNGKLVIYGTFAGSGMRLNVIPTSGGHARTLLANWQDDGTVTWSPDSRTVAAVTGEELGTKRLMLIDTRTGEAQTVTSGAEFAGVQFSPDGTQLVYARSAHANVGADLFVAGVRVVSVNGRLITALTRDQHASTPVWGPARIAFAHWRKSPRPADAPKTDIFLVRSSGSDLRQLTHTHAGFLLSGVSPLAWSARGDRMLGEFGGQDTSYAVTVDPATGKVRRLGSQAQGLVGWGLSRDGNAVLATTGGPDPSDSNVVAVPYNGGKLRVLAPHARMPSWNR